MRQHVASALVLTLAVGVLASGARVSGQGSPHGLSIPAGNFMLYFDTQRLATARQWFAAQKGTWSPRSYPTEAQAADNAFLYLMNGNTAAAQSAINWASTFSFYSTGPGNEARWMGEYQILVFSWLKTIMTAQQRQATIASINRAIANDLTKMWGGPNMPANNYNWGFTRNALLWGIASYNETYVDPQGRTQRQIADEFLTNAIVTRWMNSTAPFYGGSEARGGALPEGSHYGPYLLSYFTVPLVQSRLMTRPLAANTNFFKEALVALVHTTTPKPTYGSPRHNIAPRYQIFAYGDEQDNDGFPTAAEDDIGLFVTMAAQEWSGTTLGQYARHWLNRVQPASDPWLRATDTGAGQPSPGFGSLPLDYYSSGAGYFYTRDTWGSTAADKPTVVLMQLKQAKGSHAHCDAGSFQMLRNDRWLTRETPGRSVTYANHNGTGTISDMTVWAHNGLTVNNSNVGEFCGDDRTPPVVTRLESRPSYAYAAVDLSQYHAISIAPNIVREFVHAKDLDTLVVFDRIRSTSDVPKTFLVHFQTNPTRSGNVSMATSGNEQLRLTTLTSAISGQSTSYTVIDEASAGGGAGGTWEPQHRLQITTQGTLDSYHINVLQGRSVGDSDVTASLGQTATDFTVTLTRPGSQTVVVTFNKGMTSSGGSIQVGSSLTGLHSGVQNSIVTDAGVSWGVGIPPTPTAPRSFRVIQ
jgi:Heparinase II/III-like protein